MFYYSLLHRDLKPDNVLVVSEVDPRAGKMVVTWKLADFEIAKLLSQDGQGRYYAATTLRWAVPSTQI